MPDSLGPSRRLHASLNEDVSVPLLGNPRTQDVFNSIVKGRKSWKTLRGGEVVWPPELEAALIEGLENYKPDDSRETRLLGRFPLRNRFISDWIFEKTGTRRTAKQVGSRLQQLRDTCGGKKLVNLISPRRPIPRRISASPSSQNLPLSSPSPDREGDTCSDASSSASPSTPTEVHATLQSLLYRGIAPTTDTPFNSVVYIDLLHSSSDVKGFSDLPTSSTSAADELMWSERGFEVVKISSQPRYIADIDPSVTFTSRSPKSGISHFSLYLNGELLHAETSELKALGPLPGGDGHYLHSTTLLPGYWPRLIQTPDLSQCIIVHRVEESTPGTDGNRATLFSTMYKFRYTQPSFGNEHYGAPTHRLDSIDAQKVGGLDYAVFDSMLSLPSPESYGTPSPVFDKPQNLLYDLQSPYMKPDWTGYSPYHGAH